MTGWGNLLHDSTGKMNRFCTRPGFGMAKGTAVSLSGFHFRQIVRGAHRGVNRLNLLSRGEYSESTEFSLPQSGDRGPTSNASLTIAN